MVPLELPVSSIDDFGSLAVPHPRTQQSDLSDLPGCAEEDSYRLAAVDSGR